MTGWNEPPESVEACPNDIYCSVRADIEPEIERVQAVEDMALINAINEAANRGDSLHEIFELLTQHTIRLFDGFGATVYLLDAEKKNLDIQHFELSNSLLSAIERMLGLKLKNLRISLKPGSLYLKYLEEKTPRIIMDESSIHEFLSELAQGDLEKRLAVLPAIIRALGIGSVISVPLIVRGESIGIIDVVGKGKFTEEDLKRLKDIARQMTGVICRKKMEEQLRWERDFNVTLIESSPALFLAVDGEGRIIMMNSTMLKMLGYEKKEVIGRDFLTTLVAEPYRKKLVEMFQGLLEKKKAVISESHIIAKDGRELVVEWHAQSAQKPDGELDYYFGVGVDLTERKILQEQLIMADRLAAMGELISGVAHELNNPLTGVIGFSELLLEKNIPENMREDVAIIHHEAQRAAEVVKNMLAFARKHSPSRQDVNINSVIARVLSLRTYEHKVNNIKVVTHLSHDLPDISGDVFQLQQVFLNIVINAEYFMKKTHDGGVMTISTERNGEIVRVSILDNGPGIDLENLKRIFDPFFTTKEVGVGTGLGLSLSHGIIKEHDGLIYARSKPGEGATFVVELPVKNCSQNKGLDDEIFTHTGVEKATRDLEIMNTNTGCVLIVDDEAVICKLLALRLSQGGFTCFEASNTDRAGLLLAKHPITLILMDIRMPGKSGEEYLPEVLKAYPDMAVIMVTAVNDAHMAIDCMKHGAYDYLTKPFNLDEVFMSADRAMEKRRLILENRDYQNNLEQKVAAQAGKIKASFLNSIKALAYALEAKDHYTSGHSQRVADMAVVTAREMGFTLEEQECVRLAGLIHDIGKIGIAGAVLNKEGRLTEDEYAEMKKHCHMGERILSPVMDDKELMRMVRNHHERFDGKGYPDEIGGSDIPAGAAILSVCDAFDAMTSERSYRVSIEADSAFDEIKRCRGSQFNPEVVDAFLKAKEYIASRISRNMNMPVGGS